MISIENIHFESYKFGLYHVDAEEGDKIYPMPTYVDMFCSCSFKYMDYLLVDFEKHFKEVLPSDLKLGEKYGCKGISINNLLSLEPDDTYYACSHKELLSLPHNQLKYLLKKFKIICVDIFEAKQFLSVTDKSRLNKIKKNYKIREFIDQISGPMFGFVMLSEAINSSKNTLEFKYNPEKLGIIPCHSPRPTRLYFLSKLYHKNLLQDFDWSLFPDNRGTYYNDKNNHISIKHPNSEPLRVQASEDNSSYYSVNLNYKKWPLLTNKNVTDIEKFLNDVSDQLPKTFDSLNNTTIDKSALSWAPSFIGKYKFYISVETWDHIEEDHNIFITEKTWKGLLYGIPTLICGSPGIEKKLKNYGFKFPNNSDYDHLQGFERIDAMIKFMYQDHNMQELEDIGRHNFELAWNKRHLMNLFLEHIKKGQ